MREIIDENDTKWTVKEVIKSGQGSMPPSGEFVKPTKATLIFTAQNSQPITITTRADAIDNMTDDELLALLKNEPEQTK